MVRDKTQAPLQQGRVLNDTALISTFNRVTRLTLRALRVPYALIDMVDGSQVVVTSVAGAGALVQTLESAPESLSYSWIVLQSSAPLMINDLTTHPGRSDHPEALGYGIKAYLAVPLIAADGVAVGTLAALDLVPRSWDADDLAALQDLADLAADTVVAYDQDLDQQQGLAVFQDALHIVGDQLREGIILADAEGRVIYFNERISELSGVDAESMLNGLIWDRSAARTHGEVLREDIGGSSDRMEPYEAKYTHNDDTQTWAEVDIIPLQDATNTLIGMIGIFTDITAHKQLEDQLIKLQKLESVGQVAIGVAHDFNNLLTIVLGSSQLALMDVEPHTTLYNDLDEIYRAATRAGRLTRQILAFARQQTSGPQIININDLVINLTKLLRRAISSDIELVMLPTADVALVYADPGQIEQVVLNLTLNARDRMPNGGKLFIETSYIPVGQAMPNQHPMLQAGGYVCISVRDTSDEPFDRNPDPCSTVSTPHTKLYEEADLRLSISHHIVKQAQGILASADIPGQGSSFTVYLPTSEEATTGDDSILPMQNLPHGNETILLVEDEPSLRELTARLLELCGYTILEAGDGDDALRIVREQPDQQIDMIITDLVMPQLGGKELVKRLRANQPTIKVIFISGYTDTDALNRGQLENQVAFLPKPFLLSDLAYKIRELLDADNG